MRKLTPILLLVMLAIATGARADAVTMTLDGVGSSTNPISTPPGYNIVNGEFTYPYFFKVVDHDGNQYTTPSNKDVALICDDYTDRISFGESWNAITHTLSEAETSGQMDQLSSTAAKKKRDYDAAAYLFQELMDFGPLSQSNPTGDESRAFNLAIWGIFANNVPLNDTYSGLVPSALISGAYSYIDSLTAQNLNYSNNRIVFYTPNLGSLGCTGGVCSQPQEFMGYNAVPEPASLLLLGSGLLGFAFKLRRKASKNA